MVVEGSADDGVTNGGVSSDDCSGVLLIDLIVHGEGAS